MALSYHDPTKVKSPKNCIKKVTVLFDGGTNPIHPYSIAIVNWDGSDCIGLRWNVTENEWTDNNKINGNKKCVGEPNSRGYPTWFIVPKHFVSSLINSSSDNRITEVLKEVIGSSNF